MPNVDFTNDKKDVLSTTISILKQQRASVELLEKEMKEMIEDVSMSGKAIAERDLWIAAFGRVGEVLATGVLDS